MVYFDDILTFSTSLEEHVEHLRLVFDVLREQQLYANLSKCTFCDDKVIFLGLLLAQMVLK